MTSPFVRFLTLSVYRTLTWYKPHALLYRTWLVVQMLILKNSFKLVLLPSLLLTLLTTLYVTIDLFSCHAPNLSFANNTTARLQPDTVTEICWVLSYLTAGTDQFIGKLLDEGIAPLLVRLSPHLIVGLGR